MKDRTTQIPKNNQYKPFVRIEPKKNLQVYIEPSTFKKMLKKMETGMTLSEITQEALEEYL